MQTLIMNLETLLASFKDILSSNNYDHFIQVLTVEVTQRFEKVIMKSQFNRVSVAVSVVNVSTIKCIFSWVDWC